MNTRLLSSLGLTRGSIVMKTWMPDQVGHDRSKEVRYDMTEELGCDRPKEVGYGATEELGHDNLSVIPAQAGTHACKTWMPDQVGHDSFEEVGHDSLWGCA
jgi:hypothetical protein